jgi:hypothetical protein
LVTLLVVAQAIATALLVAIGLFKGFRVKGGGLTVLGKILFAVGAVVLAVSMASVQVLNKRAAQKAQAQIEELIIKRFEDLSACAMTSVSDSVQTPPTPTIESIRIASPTDSSTVGAKHLIRGKVSDRTSEVWVLVHPLDTSAYWVQPRISLGSDGEWTVNAYFGRSGPIDSGKSFEILAIADPEIMLKEGQFFDKWPDARASSNVIVVKRK